ncbi:MAG: tRNA 2-thiouridine(34) synthase MnmA [Clostridiales bacterium]|nr:tRNA 2-thiouridine(34) synthase MnmA [Clostridiales bacterium]
MEKRKALIAMSGGVDSSVAAYLTKSMGYDPVGCTMKLFDGEDSEQVLSKTCCSLSDVEDAGSVCRKLGIPYHVFNFKAEFGEKVIDKFIKCYSCGITPNPCLDCNRYLKFEKLYERAKVLGCDKIVTGHYARIEDENGRFLLKKGLDDTKDQSYVLYTLTQDQLAHTLFPLGELTKKEVREIAEQNGFINFNKADSQDICFVPDGDHRKFIEEYTGRTYPEGDFIGPDGNVIGKHKGIIAYTIGQRKGLGVAYGEPLFVKKISPEDNRVYLGRDEELYSNETDVRDLHIISGEVPAEPFRCKVRIRYKHKEKDALVTPLGDDRAHIGFDEPQRAITPGQAAVFYDGDVVLGGGVII